MGAASDHGNTVYVHAHYQNMWFPIINLVYYFAL